MGICRWTFLSVLPLAPKIHADLLWDLSFLFGGLGILYFLIVFIFRNRLSQKNKEIRARKKELGPMISNFLFYKDDASLQEKYNYVQLKLDIRDLLKDDFNRKVLVEILLDLQKDISGDARYRLFKLYKDLGLHLDAFKKLKSWKWEVISKGILELTQLHVEESYGFIKKFINHRRGVIRKQAQLATVSLKHEGITYFLDTCKYRISEWQQLKLLDVLRNLEDFQPPRFKAWLTAKNKDVVLFALRLIKYYKQNDANHALIELVKHKNDQIKIEAINCIKEFVVFDALDTLKAVFWKCSPNIKLNLLDAIASLGKENDVAFLQMVGAKETNFMVKSKALGAINSIAPGTVMPTHNIEAVGEYDHSQEAILNTDTPNVSGQIENLEDIPETYSDDKQEEETPIGLMYDQEADLEEIDLGWELSEEASEEATKTKLSTPDSPANVNLAEEEIEQNIDQPNSVDMENKEELQQKAEAITEENEFSVDTIENQKLSSEEAYWEAVIDPENEDEIIFDLCLMEELEDILAEGVRPDDTYTPSEILPLDFLPIVSEEEIERNPSVTIKRDTLLNINVVAEVVHEDEKFAEELDRILQKIRTESSTELEEISFDFIPVVVGEEESDLIDDDREKSLVDINVEYEIVKEEKKATKVKEQQIILPWELEQAAGIASKDPDSDSEPGPGEEVASDDLDVEELAFEVTQDLDERVSIFNELFRTCDAESKLILLDEILAVGDERDLKFLSTLATDEDEGVRKKAKKIEEKLKEYLSTAEENDEEQQIEINENTRAVGTQEDIEMQADQENQHSSQPLKSHLTDNPEAINAEPFGVFDIDFELVYEEEASLTAGSQHSLQQASDSNFLGELLSIPSKIIQKFNG